MAPKSEKKAETEERLWTLFNRIKDDKRPTGPTAFAEEAGIDRTYLYSFKVLAAEVSAYGRLTQPHISRRGAGVTKGEAKKREIEDSVRREHTRWAKEMPELRRRVEVAEEMVRQRDEEIKSRTDQTQRLMRAYELLLMLAYEAGASPSELEKLQQQVA